MSSSEYRRGDIVRILPDYQDEGDDDYVWMVISEDNEEHG